MKSSSKIQREVKGHKASDRMTETPWAVAEKKQSEIDYKSMGEEVKKIARPVSFISLKRFYRISR